MRINDDSRLLFVIGTLFLCCSIGFLTQAAFGCMSIGICVLIWTGLEIKSNR